jgi:intracellular multiplication protein IcmK
MDKGLINKFIIATTLFFSSWHYASAQEQSSVPSAVLPVSQSETVVTQTNVTSGPSTIAPPVAALPTAEEAASAPAAPVTTTTTTTTVATSDVAVPVPSNTEAAPDVTPPQSNVNNSRINIPKINSRKARRQFIENGPPVVESAPLTYTQSQELMLNSAPVSPPPSEDASAAFNAMMQQNVPLTPQQVVKLRQLIDVSQRAAVIPATVPPRPVSTTIMMNLAPGTTPPAIRLAQGYVTSLVFVDSTGAPWPIAAYDIGDPKTTNIQWDNKSNVLLLQAVAPYGNSDLVIRLVGMMTPLTLELVLGQRVVDYRTDIHVSGLGPNAKDLPTGSGLPNNPNQLLLGVLDGVAPAGSRLLVVKGGDCQAWLVGDKMYLRTRLTVLSPGWIGKMVSPDGMFAYEIQKSSSVLVSQYGEPIELKIEGL